MSSQIDPASDTPRDLEGVADDTDVIIEYVWDPKDLEGPTHDEDASAQTRKDEPPKKFTVKWWHIIFLAVLVTATILLAWWQWTRFQSGSGTFQNLGYALQWPLFGAFFVYAYRMILRYENRAYAAEITTENPDFVYEAEDIQFDSDGNPIYTEIEEDFLPERPQIDIEEFNRLNEPRRGANAS